MSSEELEIFAKHFANSLNIDLVFADEPDAVPSTNGKTIVLPKEMDRKILLPLLGALMHETGHIKRTQLTVGQYASEPVKECLNVLEDLRIDAKTIKEYPNVKSLFKELLNYAITPEVLEALPKQPIVRRVLSAIVMKAYGYPVNDMDALKAIEDYGIDKITEAATKASSTSKVLPMADEMVKLLCQVVKERPTQGQGEGEGEGKDGEGDGEGSQNDLLNRLKRLQGKLQELKDKKKGLTKKERELERKISRLLRQLDKLKGIQKNLEGREKKAKRWDKVCELQNKISRVEASQADRENRLRELQKMLANIQKMIQKLDRQIGKESIGMNALTKMTEGKGDDYDKKVTQLGMDYSRIKMGFDSLREEDLMSKVQALPQNLDEIIRDFFFSIKEKKTIVEEGSRIDTRRICKLFTGETDIFNVPETTQQKTKVAFVVDRSGSMGNHRATLVLNALGTLLKSVYRVVDDVGIPLDIGVFGFGTEIRMLKDFDEEFNWDKVVYRYGNPNDGTCLYKCVCQVGEILKDNDDGYEKVMVVMTDGEVGSQELKDLRNSGPTGMKLLYIGIGHREGVEEEALFRGYNITAEKDVVGILTKALMESMR